MWQGTLTRIGVGSATMEPSVFSLYSPTCCEALRTVAIVWPRADDKADFAVAVGSGLNDQLCRWLILLQGVTLFVYRFDYYIGKRQLAMKQFSMVLKPFRAEAVLRAVADLEVSACVVREAKGYSRQKGYLDRYAGSEYSMAFLPKVEITVWVADDRADLVAERIVRAARTGRIGDGKVLVLDVDWPGSLEF